MHQIPNNIIKKVPDMVVYNNELYQVITDINCINDQSPKMKAQGHKCLRCQNKKPIYGFDDYPFIWCKSCSDIEYKDQNIDINRRCVAKHKCVVCRQRTPKYGFDSYPFIWCKPCSMIEYNKQQIDESRRCDANVTCSYIYQNGTSCPVHVSKIKPYCARHDVTQPRHRKTKELKVVDFLRSSISTPFLHNKKESIECSSVSIKYYFPDIVWDCGSWIVHGEIDEEQHKSYTCECKRIMEIVQSRLEVSTILWRYNPDSVHYDGTKWSFSENDRMKKLIHVIQWSLSDHGGEVSRQAWALGKVLIFYLFYDDMECIDENGVWPGKICYLSIDTTGQYILENVMPSEIGFII